jgi:histidinol-phosphate aminotransferase
VNALKPHLRGLPSYPYKAVAARVKLDQNEGPYDLPPELKAKVLGRLADLEFNRYPSLHADALRQQLSGWLGWPAEGIVVSPGSNLLIQVLVQAANRVLDTAPAFPHYGFSARMQGAAYQAVRLGTGFALPLEALLAAMDDPPGVLFLPNPHAPTGQLYPGSQIAALSERAAQTGWLLVLDEAYHQFSSSDHIELARANPNLALMRTFSKAWGLGGIRAGYVLASAEVANVVQNLLPPFGLPGHTQVILQTVLEHPEYTREIISGIVAERGRLLTALSKHPSWTVYPSQTNFLLVRTPDAEAAYKQLLGQGILVRRQDHYAGLEGCIRISVGTPEENNRLIEAAFALEVVNG